MKKSEYDDIIIGFGKGGKTLAVKLAKAGKNVALIEKSPAMYGGTCINVGCIPSKSLIHSAAQATPSASPELRADRYQNAVNEKRRLTEKLRKANYDKLAAFPNIKIYDGNARFTGPRQIEVSGGGEVLQLSAKHIFINTGAVPRFPPIEGIHTTPGVYTSAGMMDLDSLPETLTIIGGGYIGLEFASMYSGFGSKVTVLQDGNTFLPNEDEDIAAEIKSMLEEKGVDFRLGAKIHEIQNGPVTVFDWQDRQYTLESNAILVATGRIPNTADLNCEAAGVALTTCGAVEVDDRLRTTAPDVWAMGDAAGSLQHTYISLDDSRIVCSQLSGGKPYAASGRKNVPYSVFLSTPYARVGMNEREARAAGHHVKISRLPASAVPKAQVLKAPQGLLKAVIDAESGRILGAMLLCEEAHEIINIIKLAMDFNADYSVLRDQVFTHPTMAEALNDLFAI